METCNELKDSEFKLCLRWMREYLAFVVAQHRPIDTVMINEIIINSMWRMWGYKRLKDYLEQELKFSREEAARRTAWAINHKFEDENLYDFDTKPDETTSVK